MKFCLPHSIDNFKMSIIIGLSEFPRWLQNPIILLTMWGMTEFLFVSLSTAQLEARECTPRIYFKIPKVNLLSTSLFVFSYLRNTSRFENFLFICNFYFSKIIGVWDLKGGHGKTLWVFMYKTLSTILPINCGKTIIWDQNSLFWTPPPPLPQPPFCFFWEFRQPFT